MLFKDYYSFTTGIKEHFRFFYVLIGVYFFVSNFYRIKYSYKLLCSLLFCLIIILLNLLYCKYTDYKFLLQIIISLGVVLEINCYSIDYKVMLIGYICHLFVYMYNIITEIDPNMLFNNASRNTISVRFLIVTILLYLAIYMKKGANCCWLWPSFGFMVVSIYAIGRAGIICSVVFCY